MIEPRCHCRACREGRRLAEFQAEHGVSPECKNYVVVVFAVAQEDGYIIQSEVRQRKNPDD